MKLNQQTCTHQWKITQGFTHTYTDCSLCGAKWEDYTAWKSQESHEIWTREYDCKLAGTSRIVKYTGVIPETSGAFREACNHEFNNAINKLVENLEKGII